MCIFLKIHIQKFKTQRIDPTERIKLDQVGRREFHGTRRRISPAEKKHTYPRDQETKTTKQENGRCRLFLQDAAQH